MNSQESSEEGIPLKRKQAILQRRQATKEAAEIMNAEQSDTDSDNFDQMSESDEAISAYFDPGRRSRIAARRKNQSNPFLMFQRMQEENNDLRDIINEISEQNCQPRERDRKLEELETQMKELKAHNEISEENCQMKENDRKLAEIGTRLEESKAHNERLVERIKQLEDVVSEVAEHTGIRMQVNNDLEEENPIFPIDISNATGLSAIDIPVTTSLLDSAPQVSDFSMSKELIHNRFVFPSTRVKSVVTGTGATSASSFDTNALGAINRTAAIPEIPAFPSTVQEVLARGSSNLNPAQSGAQPNSVTAALSAMSRIAVTSPDKANLLTSQLIALFANPLPQLTIDMLQAGLLSTRQLRALGDPYIDISTQVEVAIVVAISLRVLLDSVSTLAKQQTELVPSQQLDKHQDDAIRKDIEATEETIDLLRWQLREAEEKKKKLQEKLNKFPEDKNTPITLLEMGKINQEKSISVLQQFIQQLEGDYNNTVNSLKNNLSRC